MVIDQDQLDVATQFAYQFQQGFDLILDCRLTIPNRGNDAKGFLHGVPRSEGLLMNTGRHRLANTMFLRRPQRFLIATNASENTTAVMEKRLEIVIFRFPRAR
jgi:hypothetical protein